MGKPCFLDDAAAIVIAFERETFGEDCDASDWLTMAIFDAMNCAYEEAASERDVLQKQVAELKEALASQWQPIETAPKDGTPVLLDMQDREVIIARYIRSYWVNENYCFVEIDTNVDERFWTWHPVPPKRKMDDD